MKEYILINRVPANYDRTDAQKINDAWNITTNKWKADGIFVTSFVFPSEGFLVSTTDKIVQNGNVLSDNLKVVSVIVLKANDYESAVVLAKECPHFEQSGTVEIREIMSRPS
jgi:hypothetical protein